MNIYMMIIKWYGIILESILVIGCLINIVNSNEKAKRQSNLLSIILNLPIITYLILS